MITRCQVCQNVIERDVNLKIHSAMKPRPSGPSDIFSHCEKCHVAFLAGMRCAIACGVRTECDLQPFLAVQRFVEGGQSAAIASMLPVNKGSTDV